MEAIVLAGGMGTRLKSVVSDIPKPMAAIDGKPFLHYIFRFLKNYAINRVILSVGYKYDSIKSYFNNNYLGIEVIYSVENEPLGTGGGIKLALYKIKNEKTFIVNGDTVFNINLFDLKKFHDKRSDDITIALKEMSNVDRYGIVETNRGGDVVKFIGKKYFNQGLINAGIYYTNKNILNKFNFPEKFSFEKDFLEEKLSLLKCGGFTSDAYFIDIGIPDDYKRAQMELQSFYE